MQLNYLKGIKSAIFIYNLTLTVLEMKKKQKDFESIKEAQKDPKFFKEIREFIRASNTIYKL